MVDLVRLHDERPIDRTRVLARGDRRRSPPGRELRSAGADASEVQDLLRRMRADDRDAAATFMDRYGPRIRRRIRGKLSPAMRRLYDSQEILSTLSRRLDLYVRAGRLAAMTEPELWALVYRMADHAVIDKARVFTRLQRVEDEDGPLAREFLRRIADTEGGGHEAVVIEIERVMALLSDESDRRIVAMWLDNARSQEIAECVGLSAAAVRKRWERIRRELKERLAGDHG
jgi:DNA-directed RNA polymerase specialized sigma24 family protein